MDVFFFLAMLDADGTEIVLGGTEMIEMCRCDFLFKYFHTESAFLTVFGACHHRIFRLILIGSS